LRSPIDIRKQKRGNGVARQKMQQNDRRQLESAIEVFVRGHAAVRSKTHPYVVERFGPVWVMRDAPRQKASDYRKEEWVVSGISPAEMSSIAGRYRRGHHFVCDLLPDGVPDIDLRKAYKALGYRLIATEGFSCTTSRTCQGTRPSSGSSACAMRSWLPASEE
jgi:hypothetical protein